MFRRRPEATWFACHTFTCCHSCRCVVFITSLVSMAQCAVFGWSCCCASGSHSLVNVELQDGRFSMQIQLLGLWAKISSVHGVAAEQMD